MTQIAEPQLSFFEYVVGDTPVPGEDIFLPSEDNTPEGLQALLTANAVLRTRPWPAPYDHTTHTLRLGDAPDLSWVESESVHLVVTSPPYWTLKQYKEDRDGQYRRLRVIS
jgi:modification methylase